MDDETAGDVFVGNGVLGLAVEPELQIAGTAAGEGPVAVELTQAGHVLVPRFFAGGIGVEVGVLETELRGKKVGDLDWDDLTRQQSASGIAQRAKLQCKTKPVSRAPALADMIEVFIR